MRKGLQIQPRDLDILEAVAEMRFVTVQQMAVLYPSSHADNVVQGEFRGGLAGLEKRIRKLAADGYLKRLWPASAEKERPPPVFFLGPASVAALATDRSYKPDQVKKLLRANSKYFASKSTTKQLYIEHRLGINTFHITLAVALRDHPTTDWYKTRSGSSFWLEPLAKDSPAKVTVTVKKNAIPEYVKGRIKATGVQVKITRQPDALFALELNGQRVGFLYEKDRQKEQLDTIAAKMFTYLEWYKQDHHQNLFGSSYLRVLFETETEKHMHNMINISLKKVAPAGSSLFWFTTKDNVTLDNPANVLKPIWIIGHSAYSKNRHSLIEFSHPA